MGVIDIRLEKGKLNVYRKNELISNWDNSNLVFKSKEQQIYIESEAVRSMLELIFIVAQKESSEQIRTALGIVWSKKDLSNEKDEVKF